MDEILEWVGVVLGEESRALFHICLFLEAYSTFEWISQGRLRYMNLSLCFLEEVRAEDISIRLMVCRYYLMLGHLGRDY